MPTRRVEGRLLIRCTHSTQSQARGVAVLLNPANRIHMEGIIQALRERLRPVDHVLGHVQHQEATQHGTHHGPGHRNIVTRPLCGGQSGPAATH